jgi:DNA-binding NarL/FixJ family response regulator
MQKAGLSLQKSKAAEGRLYILGPKNLQNELLCHVLNKELGTPSTILEQLSTLSSVTEDKENTPRETLLLLIDTAGLAPKRVLEELKNKNLCSNNVVAFFNLKRGLGIEQEAIRKGLRGFFYDNEGLALLLKGIRVLFDGQVWLSREILVEAVINGQDRKPSNIHEKTDLTQRELEVLALIATGANNKEVAEKLFISENTVKTHIYNIFRKINVPNRLQAALWMAHNQ